jgi:prepilin-type N-terminal cleavage/methylation domain-containing protein
MHMVIINKKGFTLVELLIAVSILAIVLGPYMTQFVTSTKIGERSVRIVRAEYLAQTVLEEEKMNPNVPDMGTWRNFEEDGFSVRITYLDETSEVNQSDKKLNLYDDTVLADLKIVPLISTNSLDLQFYRNDILKQTLVNVPFDEVLTLYLREGSDATRYDIVYEYPVGSEVIIDRPIKEEDENVAIVFETPTTNRGDTLLEIILQNETSGNAERKFELYEYNDVNKNFDFTTSNASSGDVQTVLGMLTQVSNTSDNALDYYWVHVEVMSRSGELLHELYSALRK